MIRQAQAGDREALGHLWRAYNHLLLRYFRGKGMAAPEDLASTVWIEVASSLHRFRGNESDFRRWLFTIAARRRIDDIRTTTRHGAPLRIPLTALEPDAAEHAERTAALEWAVATVRTLPPEQAEAVLLRVVADLSVSEVAEIMNKREGTVRVLVHRGLSKLAERSDVTERRFETMSSS